MPGKKNALDLPLSPAQLRSVELRVPRHETEAPTAHELPKRTLIAVEKDDEADAGYASEVPPSMPGYLPEMSTEPAPFALSPPARVILRGRELEPLDVFPPEGRRTYADCTFPWVCVCRVMSGTKGGCGVLIGPRHVLTASHVIDWRASTDSVSLVQAGSVIGGATSTHILAYEEIVDVDYTNADDDYAVIMLNARLGDRFGWLGAKTYDAAWDDETANWHNMAYAPDISSTTPVRQTGFFLDEDDLDLGGGRMLTTETGDFVKGMSGSPVFGFWGGGPYVVGVTSAGSSSYNAIAGGSNLTRLVNKARADFP